MNNDRVRKKDSARLVWDSKPRRAPNPKDIEFQTAEVVIPNPHRDEAQIPMSFRDGLLGEKEVDKQKMNRLIWGDNLLAMQALLTQGYEGKINLIYIDPPFDSKADYSHRMTIEGNEFTKEPSVIERLAYKDTWTGGTDSYLDMLYPRLQLMKRLLAEDGSLYLHCDWHVSHYVKVMLDEIFGKENFLNNLVWCYQTREFSKKYWNRKHDDLLLYKKSDKWVFNWEDDDVLEQYSEETIKKYKLHDEKGYYRLCGRGISGSPIRSAKDVDPKWEQTNPELVVRNYLGKGYAPNDYLLIDIVNQAAKERTDFDTQKPEKLLIKLIKASSKKNEIVADFFCGSGTTLAIAEKLERHWIACELGKVGIQVTRARLVELQAKPFLIENIGNYQREMIYLTGGRIWEMQVLILKLYGATPRDKVSGLGIRKVDDTEELVYVGYPDRPITAKKAEELAVQAQKLDGRGYKRLVILGWDYEYNYHQALESRKNALKDKLKVQIESRDIPPDIYDYLKKAKTEEDIEALADKVRFYERPYLRMNEPRKEDLKDGKVQIKISIKRYVLMDIPVSHSGEKDQETYNTLMKLAKDNFAVLIDYWAIDWEYDGVTFKSQWQAFRGNGKKAKTVPIEAVETLDKKKRTIAVRVVDIFGNDAGAVVEI